MYKCTSCSYASENGGNFCPNCGNRMIEEGVYCATSVTKANLGKKISALALSITGMVLAEICNSVVFVNGFFSISEADYAGGIATFVMAVVYSMLSGVPSIIALALAGSCRKVGDRTIMTRLGKIFGLIGLILTAVCLLFGIIVLIAL